MQKNKVSIYEVAALSGVSIATVSRTIAKPDMVRPATRDKVLSAIATLNWQPDTNAQALALVLASYRKFANFDAISDNLQALKDLVNKALK
jgi:LacI family transcriptional regulator